MTTVDRAGPPAYPATTEDAFLGGRLRIRQPGAAYRAGLDAVLLAAAAPVLLGRAERVLDAGAGVGVVGLAVAARIADARVTLLERAPELAALARDNIERNGFADRVDVIEADLAAAGRASNARGQQLFGNGAGAYEHVLANPPYHVAGRGTAAPDALKAGAHAMAAGDLERWLRFLAGAAAADASATLIHRADALAPLLAAMHGRFGALRVLPIHPRPGEPATRLVVQGRKGSRAPLQLLAGLTLHGPGNAFTPEVDAILRHGQPLRLGRGAT